MRTRIRCAMAGSLLLLTTVMALAGAAAPVPIRQGSGQGLPDGPGKDVTVRVCGVCHEPVRAASVRLTREGWEAVVDSMVARGAKGSPDDLAAVVDYLAAHFLGEAAQPVNVNTAPQIDLEMVAGLLRSEARSVIEYRETHGPFKTLDELAKVPGLDFKKIDSKRDFIVAM